MKNKKYLFPFVLLTLSVIACTISVNTLSGNTEPGGDTSGGDGTIPTPTETSLPPLPPPAMAVLQVAYIKSDNVWIWRDGSIGYQITHSGSIRNPVLSGDGSLVAFTRNGELWVINTDGSNERVLVNTAYLATLESTPYESIIVDRVVWRPHSHEILFTTMSIAEGSGYQMSRFDLNGVNADTPPASVTNYEGANAGGIPYPSPDGTIVAMAQPDKVIFMDEHGSAIKLTFPDVLTYSEWAFVPELTWMPGSDSVRMVVPAADPLYDPSAPSQFWNIPVSGSPSMLASFVAMAAYAGRTYISPDGQNVAYLQENSGTLFIHSINASAVDTYYVNYPSGSVGLLGWALDSVHIIFWTPNQNTPKYLSTDTNAALVDTPAGTHIQWVDSNRFLFLNGNDLCVKSVSSSSTNVDSGVTEFSHGIYILD